MRTGKLVTALWRLINGANLLCRNRPLGRRPRHHDEKDANRKPKEVCNFFQRTGRCRYGNECRYLHDRNNTQISTCVQTPSANTGSKQQYRYWLSLIPRRNGTSSLGVDTARFFRLGWELIERCDPETAQLVITKLATEEGLGMIRAMTDVTSEKARLRVLDFFTRTLEPFFRMLSHPSVINSAILETPLDTIVTFLFGPSGRRAVDVFGVSANAIKEMIENGPSEENEQGTEALTASLQILQRIVDLNQRAPLVDELAEIANDISSFIPENWQLHTARRCLLRIQARLGIDVPTAVEANNKANHNAVFDISHDLPGHLSRDGPRHDNDHEDITKIKILPTADEIHSERPEYLPPKNLDNGHLRGMAGLLDRQFRLFREDVIAPIRDVIRAEQNQLSHAPEIQHRNQSIKSGIRHEVYRSAKLERLRFDGKRGLLVVVEFDQPRAAVKMIIEERHRWWEENKLLRGDSLVSLISSTGRIIFFQVFTSHRDIPNTKDEEAKEAEEGIEAVNRRAASLFANKHRASISLAMVEPCEEDIFWIATQLSARQSVPLQLLEFPTVLLTAFEPTLRVLQNMMQSPTTVPFADILAAQETTQGTLWLHPPTYAQTRGFSFSLETLAGGNPLNFTPGQVFDHGEMQKTTTLDEAQQNSVINALSHNFALIQGPPGTGKSYTGLSIIKALLANKDKAKLGPIVCVCYTNHALDQLLEGLLDNGVEQVIRIGSRSKSPRIQSLNLFDLARKVPQTKTERGIRGRCYSNVLQEEEHISSMLPVFASPSTWQNIQRYLVERHFAYHTELFGPSTDEEAYQTKKVRPNKAIKRWLKGQGPDPLLSRPVSELFQVPLLEMSRRERKQLYNHWIEEIIAIQTNKLLDSIEDCRKAKNQVDRCHRELDIRCLEKANVVGVTTTGLAKSIETLRRLSAKVLVCEEAGEVLEAQTLTALLPSIEHAILIGDHEQLRPHIHTYEFQHDHPSGNQISLDVSLFERLVNPETGGVKLPFSTLRTQRRMHSSIAELIRRTLYPRLEDHPSVFQYPEISGMRDRLFWLDHPYNEDSPNTLQPNTLSKSNMFEVEMVNALVAHLVRQGVYAQGEIAVITPYLGQLQKLKKRLGMSFEIVIADEDLEDLAKEGLIDCGKKHLTTCDKIMQKTKLVNAVRLATVDNFQGEEAKVVVISLVRGNAERKCGFLRTSNRINVLLSRAQHGMYIIGNSDTASPVPMWAQVIAMLRLNRQIGPRLSLCCPRHPRTRIEVSTPDNFVVLSPEGGCNRRCESRLKCGHKCINRCHSEALHDAVRCLERCLRPKKGCNHSCPFVCGDQCEKACQVNVPSITLNCGHKPTTMKCHQVQDSKAYCCQAPTETTMPICGHKTVVPCGKLPLGDSFRCTHVCGQKLPCGHACTKLCWVCKPVAGSNEFNHGPCKVECGRAYNTCNHSCTTVCHGDDPCPLCEHPCEIRCAHSQCAKKCHEPCAPCAEECTWSCPHQGKCKLPCAVPCNILPCSERCSNTLSCGHRCPSICGEECPEARYCQKCGDASIKQSMVDYIMGTTYADVNLDTDPCIIPQCGHVISLESLDAHQGVAEFYIFSEKSDNSNKIVGLKSVEPLSESDGRRCPVCRGPLNDIKRYMRILKRRWIDEATKKFIAWAHKNFLPLADEMTRVETKLRDSEKDDAASVILESSTLNLKGMPDEQISDIRKVVKRDGGYLEVFKLRRRIRQFLAAVDESEQPFQRIRALVEAATNQHTNVVELKGSPTLLQMRHRLLTTVLLLRCDYAIVCRFLNQAAQELKNLDITADFGKNRQDCDKLIEESQRGTQPAITVEARIFWARFAGLERGMKKEDRDGLQVKAREHLQLARGICAEFPSQTAGLTSDIQEVEKMLRQSTFYLPVTNGERAAVYAAMALELQGTGQWYYCVNGHPFTIGECGMPMEEAVCPQCGSQVGGREHRLTEGVTPARDLDDQFARLAL